MIVQALERKLIVCVAGCISFAFKTGITFGLFINFYRDLTKPRSDVCKLLHFSLIFLLHLAVIRSHIAGGTCRLLDCFLYTWLLC